MNKLLMTCEICGDHVIVESNAPDATDDGWYHDECLENAHYQEYND